MFERLDAIVERYEKVNRMLADPKIATDIKKLKELSKELSTLDKIVQKYKEYQLVESQIKDLKQMRYMISNH